MTEKHHGAALTQLAKCRDEIESIDKDLIALLSRRLALGAQIGDLKREEGMPILDPSREAAVIRRVTESARAASLPVEPIREIFLHIVAMSRRAQEGK